ncbi:hypothetical protein M8C21_013309 [Ambrosia artemisiifolia]|uniref:Uncharacterized protein n=1 Tax=Ambrosia artemisiifolia TaxID=4212 RepID=A0AAD5C854_AMBAR|nr:hypothetical protein M8C21_013309 [Ambrosia artemisiifolia]
MDILVFVVVVVFFSYAILSIFGFGKPMNLPPGPTPLPIIGNLHLLGRQPHRSLAKLAHTHGPVMLLKLGQNTTLVISSIAAAKEVLQKQDLAFSSTRHIPDSLTIHNFSKHSLGFLPIGTRWRFLRRILNTNIFSGKSLEASQHLRDQKVQELIDYCNKACLSNDYVDIGHVAFTTSLSLLSNTIFSKDLTCPYEDSTNDFREVVGNIMEEAGKPNLVDFFPVLKVFDPQGIRRRMTRHVGKVLSILEELIEERFAMGGSKKDDVLEMCLRINQDNPEELSKSLIKFLILDMFIAGTHTLSSTVEWAMAELLRNPHIMAKSKEELEQVVGKGKIIKEHDFLRLPYLSSIVKETFRLHPPAPLLLPRKAENQVKLNGYIIPKGTQVLVNAWAIGQDPIIWEDSKEFKPERFLDCQIDVRGQDFELIPFGAGRRICPGMPLALSTIHMMLGSLPNNFDWKLDSNVHPKELDMTERFGITLQIANPISVVPIPLM